MTEHTPGPWTIRRALNPTDGGFDYAVGAVVNGKERCIIEAFAVIGEGVRVNAEANARLIAAAPETAAERDRLRADKAELLAALKDILQADFLSPEARRDAVRRAGAAIAAAEGKTP